MEGKSLNNMDFSLTFINAHASVQEMENNKHTVLSLHQNCFSPDVFPRKLPPVKYFLFSQNQNSVKMKNQTEKNNFWVFVEIETKSDSLLKQERS